MNEQCLKAMREIYAQFSGAEISDSIKLIRAELTAQEDRHELQQEIIEKQQKLDKLSQK